MGEKLIFFTIFTEDEESPCQRILIRWRSIRWRSCEKSTNPQKSFSASNYDPHTLRGFRGSAGLPWLWTAVCRFPDRCVGASTGPRLNAQTSALPAFAQVVNGSARASWLGWGPKDDSELQEAGALLKRICPTPASRQPFPGLGPPPPIKRVYFFSSRPKGGWTVTDFSHSGAKIVQNG